MNSEYRLSEIEVAKFYTENNNLRHCFLNFTLNGLTPK